MQSIDEKLVLAQTAQSEELWTLVRDSHPAVIQNAVLNRNLTEDMALFLAKRRNVPAEVLGMLAQDKRFKDSYKLKLLICKNPKTPQRITFSLIKFLRIFDLADITRDKNIPITVRQKIGIILLDKIPALPSGVKTALAKRSDNAVIIALIENGSKETVCACLDSPLITEAHLIQVINKPTTKPIAMQVISAHPKWSLRYQIRLALIRNFYTPMAEVIEFLSSIKTTDLQELYSYEGTPSSTKPYIHRELIERGEKIGLSEDLIYELPEED